MSNSQDERKPRLPYGSYATIARRLRPPVSIVSVRSVYLGLSKSARIQRAIDNYVKRLDAQKKVA